jgi:hypothetical protein
LEPDAARYSPHLDPALDIIRDGVTGTDKLSRQQDETGVQQYSAIGSCLQVAMSVLRASLPDRRASCSFTSIFQTKLQ